MRDQGSKRERKQAHFNSIQHQVEFYLEGLKDAIDQFKRSANPEIAADNRKCFGIQLNLELFGILTPMVLKEYFEALPEENKSYISKKITYILDEAIDNPVPLQYAYERRRKKLYRDPEVLKIKDAIAFNISTGARQLHGTNWFLEVKHHNDFLRSTLFDRSVTFSFHSLVDDLKNGKSFNYNQRKGRNRMDKKEKAFAKLLSEGKFSLSKNWKEIQVTLSEHGHEVQETALRKYIDKYSSR